MWIRRMILLKTNTKKKHWQATYKQGQVGSSKPNFMEWILIRSLMIFFPQSTIQQGDEDVTMTNIGLQALKKSEITHHRLEVNIYRGDTAYDFQVYE